MNTHPIRETRAWPWYAPVAAGRLCGEEPPSRSVIRRLTPQKEAAHSLRCERRQFTLPFPAFTRRERRQEVFVSITTSCAGSRPKRARGRQGERYRPAGGRRFGVGDPRKAKPDSRS